jgi:hypothetical protein
MKNAMVTDGFRCPPLTCPKTQTNVAIPNPKDNEI